MTSNRKNKYNYQTLQSASNKNVSTLLVDLGFNKDKDKDINNYLTTYKDEEAFFADNNNLSYDEFYVTFVHKILDDDNRIIGYNGKMVLFNKDGNVLKGEYNE